MKKTIFALALATVATFSHVQAQPSAPKYIVDYCFNAFYANGSNSSQMQSIRTRCENEMMANPNSREVASNQFIVGKSAADINEEAKQRNEEAKQRKEKEQLREQTIAKNIAVFENATKQEYVSFASKYLKASWDTYQIANPPKIYIVCYDAETDLSYGKTFISSFSPAGEKDTFNKILREANNSCTQLQLRKIIAFQK